MNEISKIAGRHEAAGISQFAWLLLTIVLATVTFFQIQVAFGGITTPVFVWKLMLLGATGWLAVWLVVVVWRSCRDPGWLIFLVTVFTTISIAGLCTPLITPLVLGVNTLLAIVSFFVTAMKFVETRKL